MDQQPSSGTLKGRKRSGKISTRIASGFASAVPVKGTSQTIKPPAITDCEWRFILEYCIDHNATRAYQLAYPNANYTTARTQSSRLIAKPSIKAEIDAAKSEYLQHARVTAKRVLRELANIAFADPIDLVELDGISPKPLSKVSPRARRTICSSKTKRRRESIGETQWEIEEIEYKTHSKMDALKELCKHLGLTNDGEALKQLLETLSARSQEQVEPADRPIAAQGASAGSSNTTDRLPAAG